MHTMYCTSYGTLFLQRLIQTEADLMRLEEVHASLFREHKNLQEDYERIHVYVEVMLTCTTTVRYTCLQICNNPKIAIDTVGIGNEIRSRIAVKDT